MLMPPGDTGKKKHARKFSQSIHTPSSSSSKRVKTLDQMAGFVILFLWHDITITPSPNQIKSKTSLDTTNDKTKDSDL